MNFMEHIKGIDQRIEMRKEQEYQMTLFSDSGAEISGAQCAMNSIRPDGLNGFTISNNGMPIAHYTPDGLGGYRETF